MISLRTFAIWLYIMLGVMNVSVGIIAHDMERVFYGAVFNGIALIILTCSKDKKDTQ